MSTVKQIGRNFLWLLAGDASSKLLLFITTIWLARKLTDVGFGQLNFAQAILAYLLLVVDSGLPTYGTREIARYKIRVADYLINILLIRLILAFVLFLFSTIILHFLQIEPGLKTLIRITIIFIFPRALNTEFVFQGLEKMQYVSLAQFLFQLTYFILTILIIQDISDLIKAPIFRFLSAFFVSIILIFIFIVNHREYNLFKKIHIRSWYNYISESLLLVVSYIAVTVYTSFDTLILGIYDRPEVVGWYNAAYKIIFMFITFAALLQNAFAPFFARETQNTSKLLRGISHFALILLSLGGLISGSLIVAGKYLIPILLGPTYLNSIIILNYLSIALFFIFVDTIFLGPLLYTGLQKYYLYAQATGAIINIILNIVLIPRYSFHGAAIATIVSIFMVFLVSAYYFSKHVFQSWYLFRIIFLSFVFWICFIAFFKMLVYISVIFAFLTFIFTGSILIYIKREFIKSLIHQIS